MKYAFTFVLSLLVLSVTLVAQLKPAIIPAKIIKIGSETDFTASALATFDGQPSLGSMGASRGIADTSAESLIGFQVLTVDNWLARAPTFLPTAKKLLLAEEWKLVTDWSSGIEAQFPHQVYLRASRKNDSIELFVTFFQEKDGRLKVAYTQRRSR